MPNEFENDPIFDSLKLFAGSNNAHTQMPTDIQDAFKTSTSKAKVRKNTLKGLIGALALAITLPALAAADALPEPVKHLVQSVQHAAITPVKHLLSIDTPKAKVEENDANPLLKEDEATEDKVVNMAVSEQKQEAKAIIKDEKAAAKEEKKNEQEDAKAVKEQAKEDAKAAKVLEKEAKKESKKSKP